MRVGALEGVVDSREAVDWDAVAITVADEDGGWYECLARDSAYERLVDFQRCYLKRIRIWGRSKRWWDSDLSEQVRTVRRARRRWVSCGNRNVFRAEVSKMRRLVKEKLGAGGRSVRSLDCSLRGKWFGERGTPGG